MIVQHLMKTDVKKCGREEKLHRAAQLMWDNDCGCLPVVDEADRVVGMLTDRDICMAAYTQGKPLHELPVSLAMSKKVWSIRPEDGLSAAERLLQEKKVRRLPVTDASGRLVGLVSINDIATEAARERGQKRKSVSDAEVGETLAAICEPQAVAAAPQTVVSQTVAPAPPAPRGLGAAA